MTDSTTRPWGSDEDFNPEKAWTLIQNLRAEKRELQEARDKAQADAAEYQRSAQAAEAAREAAEAKASEAETRLAETATAQAKAELLRKHDLDPEKYARFLIGDSEDDWASEVEALAELRGGSTETDEGERQVREPDPAQVADSDDGRTQKEVLADLLFD